MIGFFNIYALGCVISAIIFTIIDIISHFYGKKYEFFVDFSPERNIYILMSWLFVICICIGAIIVGITIAISEIINRIVKF